MPFFSLVIALLVCVGFVGLLLWVTTRHTAQLPLGFDPTTIDLDIVNDPEIQDAIATGKHIIAIKVYRELTGCDLRQAKDVIDYVITHPEFAHEGKKKHNDIEPLDAGLRDLVRSGEYDEAARIYRLFTGSDEMTAHDAIDRLTWEEDQRPSHAPNL